MFEWSKQGAGAVSNNDVLEFPMITGTDGAVYECTVSNAAGNETRNVTLTGTFMLVEFVCLSVCLCLCMHNCISSFPFSCSIQCYNR